MRPTPVILLTLATLLIIVVAQFLPARGADDYAGQRATGVGNATYIRTDPETGCQYLTTGTGSSAGITPRLRADGRTWCGGPTRGTP